MSRRTVYFVLLVTATVAISWSALAAVYGIAAYGDQQSHILLILPVSIVILYCDRDRMFGHVRYCLPAGVVLILFWLTSLWLAGHPLPISQSDAVSLEMSLFIGGCLSAFILCYDTAAFRIAAFPLLLLFFMVPIPGLLLERIIWLLQKGSTDTAFVLLRAANIPVAREGFVLLLPGFDIEVAKECSGIRSSLLLLVVTLVLGQLFLRSNWRKALLALLVIPIAVAKNGFRISALCALGIKVDPSVFSSDLHRYGGIPSFGLALGAVMVLVWQLHKSETGPLTAGERHIRARCENPEALKGGI